VVGFGRARAGHPVHGIEERDRFLASEILPRSRGRVGEVGLPDVNDDFGFPWRNASARAEFVSSALSERIPVVKLAFPAARPKWRSSATAMK
jgi:hypothetical protein